MKRLRERGAYWTFWVSFLLGPVLTVGVAGALAGLPLPLMALVCVVLFFLLTIPSERMFRLWCRVWHVQEWSEEFEAHRESMLLIVCRNGRWALRQADEVLSEVEAEGAGARAHAFLADGRAITIENREVGWGTHKRHELVVEGFEQPPNEGFWIPVASDILRSDGVELESLEAVMSWLRQQRSKTGADQGPDPGVRQGKAWARRKR